MPTSQKLFVVDDEKLIADAVSSALQLEGFQVETFYDGQQAMERFVSAGPPNLLVTDIGMPVLDGISLAKQVTHEWPSCKVLFLSGEVNLVERMRAFVQAPRQVDGLQKPVSVRQLIAKVRKMCR